MVMEAVAGGSARVAPARRLTWQGRPWDIPKVHHVHYVHTLLQSRRRGRRPPIPGALANCAMHVLASDAALCTSVQPRICPWRPPSRPRPAASLDGFFTAPSPGLGNLGPRRGSHFLALTEASPDARQPTPPTSSSHVRGPIDNSLPLLSGRPGVLLTSQPLCLLDNAASTDESPLAPSAVHPSRHTALFSCPRLSQATRAATAIGRSVRHNKLSHRCSLIPARSDSRLP